MSLLVDICSVSKTFASNVKALNNVSLSIDGQETLALVGGSGCGKSTLARIVSGLLAPDSGDVRWEGQSLLGMSRRHRAERVQMIFQDPYASLNPKLTVGMQLEEVLRQNQNRKSSSANRISQSGSPILDIRYLICDALEAVGLPADTASHYPFQFSGGQRQRIAIARALALTPQLLIADEPLSALDVTTQGQVLALLGDLRQRLGLTILFITHDLAVAASFADRVVVLHDGKVVETGPAKQTFENPSHAYTKALVNAIPAG